MTDGRQNMEGTIPPNTVSVYGHGADALDDFPVLKAFQQYVDSEQAKAHKRLMSVCFFFTLLIFALAGAFFYVISDLNGKGASSEATIKALSDNNAALQGQLLDQARRMNEELMSKIAAGNAASAADAELGKKNLELQMKLATIELENRLRAEQRAESEKKREAEAEERLRAALEAARREGEEKAKAAAAAAVAAERAKKAAESAKSARERELSAERRRLYPEYFDEDGNEHRTPVAKRPASVKKPVAKPPAVAVPAARPSPGPAAAKPAFDDIDALDELLEDGAPQRPAAEKKQSAAPAKKPVPAKKPAAKPAAPAVQDDGSLRFFEEDEAKIDVGESSGWTIPFE